MELKRKKLSKYFEKKTLKVGKIKWNCRSITSLIWFANGRSDVIIRKIVIWGWNFLAFFFQCSSISFIN